MTSSVKKIQSKAPKAKREKAPPSKETAAPSSSFSLANLFETAQQAMSAQRQQINDLDGHNGNHGDNMVENLQLITQALRAKDTQAPADALRYASQQLAQQGRGGTSQYYAQGLNQAASQLQGRSALQQDDVVTIVQTMLGAIPAQGYQQQQPEAAESVLGSVMNLIGGQASAPQPAPQDDGLDMGDVLGKLLPAGLAFMQAKQSGADTQAAATQALLGALMGGQANPLQASTPRAAAGGLIAQTILRTVLGQR